MARRTGDLAWLRNEQAAVRDALARGEGLPCGVRRLGEAARFVNPRTEQEIGSYRLPGARCLAISELELVEEYMRAELPVPSFEVAGPRAQLWFDPVRVRAAVVTTGGVAPGLNAVVHAITDRHINTYGLNSAAGGAVLGVHNGFKGLLDIAHEKKDLTPEATQDWVSRGGSRLGNVRYYHEDGGLEGMVAQIRRSLELHMIDVLYVLGGDGSLRVAKELARACPERSVIGIPKTMDNDILWVDQAFGFDTAVSEAARAIHTLRFEAQSTRRIGLIKLFGAESGFVAATAALATAHVDLVLIPEIFLGLDQPTLDRFADDLVGYLSRTILRKGRSSHAVVVMAEGVETVLQDHGLSLFGQPIRGNLTEVLSDALTQRVVDNRGEPMSVFVNEPRHYIRSVPPNAHDLVACQRFGALAVDAALAGYTDCLVSRWRREDVLVPLDLVVAGKKALTPDSILWKQVINRTGQPNLREL